MGLLLVQCLVGRRPIKKASTFRWPLFLPFMPPLLLARPTRGSHFLACRRFHSAWKRRLRRPGRSGKLDLVARLALGAGNGAYNGSSRFRCGAPGGRGRGPAGPHEFWLRKKATRQKVSVTAGITWHTKILKLLLAADAHTLTTNVFGE